MPRLAYIDSETTGYCPIKNAMTEVSVIIVIDGVEKGRQKFKINPYSYNKEIEVNPEALSFRGETDDNIRTFPDANNQARNFISFLEEHLEQNKKFQFVGYNTPFDIGFVKAWLEDADESYSDYFTHKDIDVFALVKHMRLWGLLYGCANDKLGTVCKHFGIELDAHDSMNDIEATRELYQKLLLIVKAKEDICYWEIEEEGKAHTPSCNKDEPFIFTDYEVGFVPFSFSFCPHCGNRAVEKIISNTF